MHKTHFQLHTHTHTHSLWHVQNFTSSSLCRFNIWHTTNIASSIRGTGHTARSVPLGYKADRQTGRLQAGTDTNGTWNRIHHILLTSFCLSLHKFLISFRYLTLAKKAHPVKFTWFNWHLHLPSLRPRSVWNEWFWLIFGKTKPALTVKCHWVQNSIHKDRKKQWRLIGFQNIVMNLVFISEKNLVSILTTHKYTAMQTKQRRRHKLIQKKPEKSQTVASTGTKQKTM